MLKEILEDFNKLDLTKEFTLQKLMSFRVNTHVPVGHTVRGEVTLDTKATKPELRIVVQGRGFKDWIMTSPVTKVKDQSKTSITFETEGGVYLLEERSNETN